MLSGTLYCSVEELAVSVTMQREGGVSTLPSDQKRRAKEATADAEAWLAHRASRPHALPRQQRSETG